MGFFEMLLISVVALVVVGPERMPEALRSVALTIGRLKRSFEGARSEIEKQIGADDIRQQLHSEAVMESLDKIKADFSDMDENIPAGEQELSWAEDDYYEKEHEALHKNDITPEADNKNTSSLN